VTGRDPLADRAANLAAPGDLAAHELEVLRSGVRLLALRSLRDPELAEEAAQETLARALAAVRDGQVRDPAHLGAFARGIARHVIADVHRARQRTIPLDDAATIDRPCPDPDALQAMVSAEESARVRAALAALSQADRELLRLSFFEGLAPAELADRLGQPATRIRKRKSRALERLREAFRKPGVERHDGPSSPTAT